MRSLGKDIGLIYHRFPDSALLEEVFERTHVRSVGAALASRYLSPQLRSHAALQKAHACLS